MLLGTTQSQKSKFAVGLQKLRYQELLVINSLVDMLLLCSYI